MVLTEELKNWMNDVDTSIIDDILEFLEDQDCLNDKGRYLKHSFWKKYIKDKS